jgi:hypothetical protein
VPVVRDRRELESEKNSTDFIVSGSGRCFSSLWFKVSYAMFLSISYFTSMTCFNNVLTTDWFSFPDGIPSESKSGDADVLRLFADPSKLDILLSA